MAAGRKAPNADALRIDAVVLGMGANGADSPLRVVKRGVEEGFGSVLTDDAVLKNESRNAELVQPLGRLFVLMIVSQEAITSARANNDGCTCRFFGWGQINGEGRPILGLFTFGPGRRARINVN